jgi:hypothetical protein
MAHTDSAELRRLERQRQRLYRRAPRSGRADRNRTPDPPPPRCRRQIIAENEARLAAAQQITKEKLIEWHNEIREQGKKNGQLSPAETAIKEISVLTGHRIERAEIGAPTEFDALSDDELKHMLIERLVGLAPTLGISIGSAIALSGNGADTDIAEGS